MRSLTTLCLIAVLTFHFPLVADEDKQLPAPGHETPDYDLAEQVPEAKIEDEILKRLKRALRIGADKTKFLIQHGGDEEANAKKYRSDLYFAINLAERKGLDRKAFEEIVDKALPTEVVLSKFKTHALLAFDTSKEENLDALIKLADRREDGELLNKWAAQRELERRIAKDDELIADLEKIFKRFSKKELYEMVAKIRKLVEEKDADKLAAFLMNKAGNLPKEKRIALAKLIEEKLKDPKASEKDKVVWQSFSFALANFNLDGTKVAEVPKEGAFPAAFHQALTTQATEEFNRWKESSVKYHQWVDEVFTWDEDSKQVKLAEGAGIKEVNALRKKLLENYDSDELTTFANSMLDSDNEDYNQIGAKLMAALSKYTPAEEGEDPAKGTAYFGTQRTELGPEGKKDDLKTYNPEAQAFELGQGGVIDVPKLSQLLASRGQGNHGLALDNGRGADAPVVPEGGLVHRTNEKGEYEPKLAEKAIPHSDEPVKEVEPRPEAEESEIPKWESYLVKKCASCHQAGGKGYEAGEGSGEHFENGRVKPSSLNALLKRALVDGDMPPEDAPQLSKEEKDHLLASCKKEEGKGWKCEDAPKKESPEPVTTEPTNQEVHLPADKDDPIHAGVKSCKGCHGSSKKDDEDRLFWIDETSGSPVIKPTKPGAKLRPIVERMAEVLQDPSVLEEGTTMRGRAAALGPKHSDAFAKLASNLTPSEDGQHFVRGSEPVKREDDDEGTGGKDNGDGRTPGDDNGTQATWESLNDGAAGIKLAASLKGGNCAGCHGVNDDGGRPFQIDTDTNGNPTRFRFKGKDSKEASLALLKAVLQTGDVKMPKKTSVETEQPRLSRGQISAFAEWAKSKGVDLSTVKAGDSQFKIVRPVLPDIPLFVSLPTEIPRRWNGTQLTDNARVGLVVQGPSGSLFVRQANGSFAPIPDTKTFVTTDELNPQLPPGTSPSCSGPGDPKCKSMGFNVRNGRIEGGLIAAPSIP